MARFSTNQYDFGSVECFISGQYITGLRGFTVTVEQEKEQIFGAGNTALGIGVGNKTVSGEVVMLQSSFEALTEVANGDILNLRDLQLIFTFVGQDGTILKNVVWGAQFTNYDKSLTQNDKFMEITIPFVALDFDENE